MHMPKLNWQCEDMVHWFKLLYLSVKSVKEEKRADYSMLGADDEGLKSINFWTLSADERMNPYAICKKFESQTERRWVGGLLQDKM